MRTKIIISLIILIVLYSGVIIFNRTSSEPVFLAFSLLLAGLLIWISIQDFIDFTIPDTGTIAIAFFGLIVTKYFGIISIPMQAFSGFISFFSIWLIGEVYYLLRGKDGLGIGDAKLLGAATMWVGLEGITSVIFIAAICGMLFSLAMTLSGKSNLNTPIPFGPFIAIGFFQIWMTKSVW